MAKPNAAAEYNPDPAYINDLIASLPYTQAELAEILGCTDRAIRHWRQGRRQFTYPVQFALECLVLQSE